MLLYFITTGRNQLVIAKSDKGITKQNNVKQINVRLKEMKNGDTVKQLLKLLVFAYNVKGEVARHIFLTHLYPKFLELDEDNLEVQKYFFDIWTKSLLKTCHTVVPEFVNHDAVRKHIENKSLPEDKKESKKKTKKSSVLTKHSRRK